MTDTPRFTHRNPDPHEPLTASSAVVVTQPGPGLLSVVIDHPPLNLFDPELFAGLRLLRAYLNVSPHIQVLVLESANPEFFIAHLDAAALNQIPDIPGAASIAEHWPDLIHWLTSLPALTIAKLRGRAPGIGNELAYACDLRFAALENTRLGQIEAGFGTVSGGGAIEWLPRLVGRARALEIILGADNLDAETAERYGLINRALPDAQLDHYVDALARRVASHDPDSIRTVKHLIDQRTPPPSVADFAESFAATLHLSAAERATDTTRRPYAKTGGSPANRERDLPDRYRDRDEHNDGAA